MYMFIHVNKGRRISYNKYVLRSYPECIKNVSVKCLQSLEDLKKMCDKMGLKFANYSEIMLQVDFILSDDIECNEKFYLVKWRGRGFKYNSWEPASRLIGSENLLSYYNYLKDPPAVLSEEIVSFFINDLSTRKPYDILTISKLYALIYKYEEQHISSFGLSVDDLKRKISEFLDNPENFQELLCLGDKLLNLMKFAEKRKVILSKLKEWEAEINAISSVYVKVENNVDLENPPINFQFISNYISSDVDLSENPIVFCSCIDCSESPKACCPFHLDGGFAYDKEKCLKLPKGYPIYECNKLCKCDNNCTNRVVQHGPNIKVAIFRTKYGCGWGVKTLEPIKKGRFVLEYLGEVITSERAAKREEVYIHLGRTYVFDMGYQDPLYTIDAMIFGNASHFINHSCDPNLVAHSVWINQQNPKLPRVALFAKRKINPGEELTFDYAMHTARKGDPGDSKNGLVSCKCMSKKCRKYL